MPQEPGDLSIDARQANELAAHSRVATLFAAVSIGALCLLMGLTGAADTRLVTTVHGDPMPWAVVIGATTPRWLLLAIALPLVLVATLRRPPWQLDAFALVLQVVMSVAVITGHAVVHTLASAMPILFDGPLPFGLRAFRAGLSSAPLIVPLYAGTLLTAWGMDLARERRRRALREAKLEAQLHAARLAALKAQLHPHFLYNTLNGISALVADRQHGRASVALEQLAELLHAAFRDDGRELITLAEEVALAERYLGLQQLRFGDRLSCEIAVSPGAARALVPPLILQPLVENAVLHGLSGRSGSMRLTLEACVNNDDVGIVISHDGPELPHDWTAQSRRGVGLRNTRERLASVYGDRAGLLVRRRVGGGVEARLHVPAPAPASVVDEPVTMQHA
jgi:sensor histidine kinase YesM